MSTRTIIEINHDYLPDLIEDPEAAKNFFVGLACARPMGESDRSCCEWIPNGIRIFGQRHHSDKLVVKLGNQKAHEE